ncbi:hypothetical protein ACQVRV_00115 (plasmid) [Ralstonia pseudosolanacearum]
MADPLQNSDANRALLSDFPGPVQAVLHLVDEKPLGEASLILVQMLASAAHPDYLCSVSTLASLPEPHKAAALDLLQLCLTTGMTIEQRAALLRLVQPRMFAAIGAGTAPR